MLPKFYSSFVIGNRYNCHIMRKYLTPMGHFLKKVSEIFWKECLVKAYLLKEHVANLQSLHMCCPDKFQNKMN